MPRHSVGSLLQRANQLVGIAGLVGAALTLLYMAYLPVIHNIPPWMSRDAVQRGELQEFVVFFGLGMVFRIVSDVFGAALQVRGWIATDNLLLAGTEWAWIILVVAASSTAHGTSGAGRLELLNQVALAWLTSSAALVISAACYPPSRWDAERSW